MMKPTQLSIQRSLHESIPSQKLMILSFFLSCSQRNPAWENFMVHSHLSDLLHHYNWWEALSSSCFWFFQTIIGSHYPYTTLSHHSKIVDQYIDVHNLCTLFFFSHHFCKVKTLTFVSLVLCSKTWLFRVRRLISSRKTLLGSDHSWTYLLWYEFLAFTFNSSYHLFSQNINKYTQNLQLLCNSESFIVF